MDEAIFGKPMSKRVQGRYCVTCRFYEKHDPGPLVGTGGHACTHELVRAAHPDPITGPPEFVWCTHERIGDYTTIEQVCGTEGRLWTGVEAGGK